jgi:hypothetical protein
LNTNLTYEYGATRSNYVSSDKRMKTTIFGNSEVDVSNILKRTFNIIDEAFDNNLLTIPSGKGKRPLTYTKS